MISIIKVWERVMELAKVGTAGYDDQKAFNDKIYQVQLELVEMLTDVYETNKKAADALALLITETAVIATDGQGKITKDATYLHLCTIFYVTGTEGNYKNWPTHKLMTNEVAMVETSPVRAPNLAINEALYYFSDNFIKMLPRSQMNVVLIYCKQPPAASIVLTRSSTADSDFLVPTAGTDLFWPITMFNLIVYLTLEKLGIEMKEELLAAFSALGINRETIKTTAQ